MKKIKLLTHIGLLTAATATLATSVNVNHLAPFADTLEGTAVSVNVDGAEVLPDVKYLQSSGYLNLAETGVAPGDTTLEVFAPPGASNAAISATVNLEADTFYSVTAIGDGNNQPLSLLALEDSRMLPADGSVMIRVIHAAPFAAELAATGASIRTDEGMVVNGLSDVQFGQDSGFFELPAGTYDLNVSNPDGSTRLIDLAPVDLPSGTIVNIFAVGDGSNQDLGAYAVFGDGSVSSLALEQPPAPTRVNVAHLAPFASDISATAVSVDVNGTEVLNDVTYKQVSGYLPLAEDGSAPGNTLLEVFAPPGATDPAIMATVNLAAQTDYTVVAIGDGNNQPLSLLPLVDDNSAPGAGNVKVRVVHSAPFAAALMDTAVSVRTDSGDLVSGLTGVEFGQQSGYFELPAGTYDLNIATPDGGTRLIDLAPVTLTAGDIVTLYAIGEGVNQPLGIMAVFSDGSSAALPLEPPFEVLNAGLNGAWHNPDTSGQGLVLEVFPQIKRVHAAWFTYDTTFADGGETAVVGDPNHRWYTVEGTFEGTTATLDLVLTRGGIFNDEVAVERTDAGDATLIFDSCTTGVFNFTIDGSGLTGSIPITRINGDNVPLCESLAVAAE